MCIEFLLAAAFQVGPFYQQKTDYAALRPFWSAEAGTTDVLWPLFTAHRDWWRCLFFIHEQDYPGNGYQFEVMPLWFNGRERDRADGAPGDSYWGLFPIWGRHPHVLTVYDWRFCLWPLWMRYSTPRPSTGETLVSNAVLFPFFHWRSDGAWGFWPLYVQNYQRESTHRTALWPLFTWASYRKDRDTAGEGTSWMVWPLCASVSRERESQTLVLPPLFSYARVPDGWRGRFPWPLVEIERRAAHDRLSVFPFYEHVDWKGYTKGEERGSVTRFGWKLVELYDDETRVFPFWTSRRDDSYFRLWPFWESAEKDGVSRARALSLLPIRWVPAVERNWAKFWTFYERERNPIETRHALLWGIIRWRSTND